MNLLVLYRQNRLTLLLSISTLQLFCIRCEDVGLDCNCIIYGIDEEKTICNTALHMFADHAIKPEEMTKCMRLKIKDNMHLKHLFPPLPSQLAFNFADNYRSWDDIIFYNT